LGKRLAALGLKAAVDDERTFTVTTDKPSSLVLTAFAKPTGSPLFVMRAKDAANEPTQRVTANIGSGPFRFVAGEYVPGSKIVYERNADYVPRAEPASFLAGGKRVHVNRVEFRIITDPSTATAALASGEVDIYEAPPADLLPQLQRSKEVVTKVIDKGGIMTVIRPNTLQPPFDNVLARRALLHAVDQSDYVQLMGGAKGEFARQCHSFLGCGFEGYSEAGMDEFKKPSTEKAKALLKQAGYKGEPIIVMHPMEYPPITDQTSVAVEQLRKAGFNVQPMSMDWAALTARRANRGPAPEGGWNLFLTYTYSFNMASPALNFYLASPCGGGGWFGWPCDKKIEALTDEWMAEVDLSKRSAIERQIHLQARESLPYVPVSQSFSPVAYRKNIVDLMEVPATVFWNVRKTAK
ncbi:MAG: ABC transporter substrate-binding protein, partial [Burkholderiaceae bacterium]